MLTQRSDSGVLVQRHAVLPVPMCMKVFSPKEAQLQATIVKDTATNLSTVFKHCYIKSKVDLQDNVEEEELCVDARD